MLYKFNNRIMFYNNIDNAVLEDITPQPIRSHEEELSRQSLSLSHDMTVMLLLLDLMHIRRTALSTTPSRRRL